MDDLVDYADDEAWAPEPRRFAVYALVDSRFDAVRYVGRTAGELSTRLRWHLASPLPLVRPWLDELHREGLRPQIRLLQEIVVPGPDEDAEAEQIRQHAEAGCLLLNQQHVPHVAREEVGE